MTKQKKCALGAGNTQERGRTQQAANVLLPLYHFFSGVQPPPITIDALLDNAESLLCDPAPEAMGWAATLLDLAHQAMEKSDRAAFLADCCEAAGDLDGHRFWLHRQQQHRAVYQAATHPTELT